MSKKHDENRDLKSFARIGRVNYGDKTLVASKSATIGIHLLGKIDYLTKYCGWSFYYNNDVKPEPQSSDVDVKVKKEVHKLTNKKK